MTDERGRLADDRQRDRPARDEGRVLRGLADGRPDQLISLGVLDSRHSGTFPVPADVDVASYPFVDVSLEPLDGNPAHSSDSVVRGTLPA